MKTRLNCVFVISRLRFNIISGPFEEPSKISPLIVDTEKQGAESIVISSIASVRASDKRTDRGWGVGVFLLDTHPLIRSFSHFVSQSVGGVTYPS